MMDAEREELAEELRSRARDLYRRSDNVPLGRGASQAAIDRVGDLREKGRRADGTRRSFGERRHAMTDSLMSRDEVAKLLGISPESVRKTLGRHGITEQRGYPREAVENLKRPKRGYRTDLHGPYTPTTEEEQ